MWTAGASWEGVWRLNCSKSMFSSLFPFQITHTHMSILADKYNLDRWIPPDSQTFTTPKIAYTASDPLPRMLSSLRMLQGTKTINDATCYSYNVTQEPRTVVLPNANREHWFAIRSLRGDHPSKSPKSQKSFFVETLLIFPLKLVHMHDHEFQIIAKLPAEMGYRTTMVGTQGVGWYVKDFVDAPINYASIVPPTNPSRRDTIMVEKGTTVIIAIKASNPGAWVCNFFFLFLFYNLSPDSQSLAAVPSTYIAHRLCTAITTSTLEAECSCKSSRIQLHSVTGLVLGISSAQAWEALSTG